MAFRGRSLYRKTPTRRSVAIVSFLPSLLISQLAHAGFFDQLVNDAQRSIERGVESVMDNAKNGSSDDAAQNADTTPQTPSSPASTAAMPSVKQPSFDRALVKDIQQRLNSLGFNSGPPDGIYGAGTRQAIESFQRSQGMAVDGKPSAELLAQIESTTPVKTPIAAAPKTPQTGGMSEPTLGAMMSAPSKRIAGSTSRGYIAIQDIPAGRRPATFGTLGLARLRHDTSWLDKNLLKATQLSIGCQQYFIRHGGVRGSGCMGEFLGTARTVYKIRLAPVFTDEEIKDRNPKFAAQEFKSRIKPAFLKLAEHLPPEFGDTVRWRGKYDFEKGVLNISIQGYDDAPRNIVNRLPSDIKHLDLRNPKRANFDGTAGEYHQLKVWTPYVEGVYALAFDRDLSQGQIPMPPAEAEKMFKAAPKDYVIGQAVVEYKVNNTVGEAALATLEQVRIISAVNDVNPINARSILVIPGSAFPKLERQQQEAKAPAKKSVEVAKSAPIETSVSEPDPLERIRKRQPYGPDIVGLQLGMTIEQAEKLIRKRKEPTDIIEGNAPAPFKTAKLYVLAPGDETISLMTMDSPAGERIAGYVRTVAFERDSAPSEVAIASSLEKKYGIPFYSYDAKESHFDRRWFTNWKGQAVTEQNSLDQNVGKCEAAVRIRPGLKTWLASDGQPYRWFAPGSTNWNSPQVLEAGDLKKAKNIHRCGPAVVASYQANSGQPIGPSLTLTLFDGAWIMDAVKERNAKEKAQGAQNLDL